MIQDVIHRPVWSVEDGMIQDVIHRPVWSVEDGMIQDVIYRVWQVKEYDDAYNMIYTSASAPAGMGNQTRMHACMHTSLCMHACTCPGVRSGGLYIHMYLCMYICVCMYAHTYACIFVYMYACIHRACMDVFRSKEGHADVRAICFLKVQCRGVPAGIPRA